MDVQLIGKVAEALPVLITLRQQGYDCVFVGGCVRDYLLERDVHDVDLATSATPAEMMAIFSHYVATGEKHGTITVFHAGVGYEVTTFRLEADYESHRRPVTVDYVHELTLDLQRRDFTINAMAIRYDEANRCGTLIDPFGGQQDLQSRTLRAVGDANARFDEDALRMVRGVRFAAEYGLTIAFRTWASMKRFNHLLSYIAMERIGAELDKMMNGANPLQAITLFARSGLYAHVKQQLPVQAVHALQAVATRRWTPLQAVQPSEQLAMLTGAQRWLWFVLVGEIDATSARQLFATLRYSNERQTSLEAAVAIANRMQLATSATIDELRPLWIDAILAHGVEAAKQWLAVAPYLSSPMTPTIFSELDDCMANLAATTIAELQVTGHELLQRFQRRGGPWLGQLLSRLLHAVAHRRVANDKQLLLQLAPLELLALERSDRS